MEYTNRFIYYFSLIGITVTVAMWFVPYHYSLSDFVKNRTLDGLFILYFTTHIVEYKKANKRL